MTKVFECGTKAITITGKIEGIITGISIRFDKVSYEFSYFYNGDYKSVFLNENEFSVVVDTKKAGIGYR